MTTQPAWVDLIGGDPRPWIAQAGDPAVAVDSTKAAIPADPLVQSLLERLPDWEVDNGVSGHNSPGFAPNLLNLLADLGFGPGDDPRIERLLDQMLVHQDADGRFQSFGRQRGLGEPVWDALLCDAHAITEVLIRFGRGADPRVQRALTVMAADLVETAQGIAWPCRPSAATGFRGPGRKADMCPQVTLEALRACARAREAGVPGEGHATNAQLLAAARAVLRAWRERGREKPYMFGHGYQFKTVKWPNFWYDVLQVLDAVSLYPDLWRGTGADPADRRAAVELLACLVRYNFGAGGTVTPRSCYRGFEQFSFGQKKVPSPFATARCLQVIMRLEDLAAEAAEVDVTALSSSKGGSGTARPPRT